jgi:hypothetical protein
MYKRLIKEIENLPWSQYDPKEIIFISLSTAVEFAESLRCALKVFPENTNLQEMAYGELNTDNLSYDDYSRKGDHWQFLNHFCQDQKTAINSSVHSKEKIAKACSEYHKLLESMTASERAMTIFSREHELPSIFEEILAAHQWKLLGFGFYQYYLEQHILLDSNEGGHGDLVADFELDDKVMLKFYEARLELYKSLL